MSDYLPTPTLSRFHASQAFYRLVIGPVGSGKSTGCCAEIMSRAMEQSPGPDKIRRSRWVVVRNTYRELRDTTVKTWLDWFPESSVGRFSQADMTHRIKFGDVEAEVMFRALDRPDDVKKLLSLELTGAWVNEAREVPKSIVDALGDRVERYPAAKDGGCTWAGVILDTNPPDEDHWIYRMAEEERPSTWEVFKQPGGLIEQGGRFVHNPAAENLGNLPRDYYLKRMEGKPLEHVRVYYAAQYGFAFDGKPIFPEYVDAIHCHHEPISPIKGIPLFVGLDFGLTPAAIIAQRLPIGRWVWIDELVAEDMGAVRFGELLSAKLIGEYGGYEVNVWGDPAGESRSDVDERTPMQILRAMGIPCKPTPTNDFTLRREALARPLSRLIDGKPGLIISPRCKVARKGLAGGYCYKRLKVAGDAKYHDKPDKGPFSHVVEAGEYAMLGGGEGLSLLRNPHAKAGPRKADFNFQFSTDRNRSGIGNRQSSAVHAGRA